MPARLFRSLAGCFLVFAAAAAWACPFCSGPQLTLAEQIEQADAVVLVKWTGGTPAKEQNPGETNFEVVQLLAPPKAATEKKLAAGDKLELVRYRMAKVGDLFLLFGTKTGAVLEWGSPMEVSQAGFTYLKNLPSPAESPAERLTYVMDHLEDPDAMISGDAYGEFAKANYDDIKALADEMPREKLREWLVSPETSASRLGLYGLMLGLCGEPEDIALMEAKITDTTGEFRLGIDGVMGGYLLLAGEKGLDVLDDTKLKDPKATFSETYAAMGAIRFIWQYGKDTIPPARLRTSMRLLLEKPELADLVIADLARMEDWDAQDRLMEMYGTGEYDIPSIKRSIIRYMLVSAKFKPQSPEQSEPEHVLKGKKYLAQLEERDPKTVKDAKRFWVVK